MCLHRPTWSAGLPTRRRWRQGWTELLHLRGHAHTCEAQVQLMWCCMLAWLFLFILWFHILTCRWWYEVSDCWFMLRYMHASRSDAEATASWQQEVALLRWLLSHRTVVKWLYVLFDASSSFDCMFCFVMFKWLYVLFCYVLFDASSSHRTVVKWLYVLFCYVQQYKSMCWCVFREVPKTWSNALLHLTAFQQHAFLASIPADQDCIKEGLYINIRKCWSFLAPESLRHGSLSAKKLKLVCFMHSDTVWCMSN